MHTRHQVCFGWGEQMSSLLTSLMWKGGVSCGGSTPLLVWYCLAVFLIGFFYFIFFWTVSHGRSFYCLAFLVSFWCQFVNKRAYTKLFPIFSKPSPKFTWWNTIHIQLILKSTKICSKFVLVEMFSVVMDNTNINIYRFD